MKSGNKKGILLLIFISIILCVACLIEYALLSSSREQNRKLRSGQVQAENSRKATAAKKKQELAGDGVKAHGKYRFIYRRQKMMLQKYRKLLLKTDVQRLHTKHFSKIQMLRK